MARRAQKSVLGDGNLQGAALLVLHIHLGVEVVRRRRLPKASTYI